MRRLLLFVFLLIPALAAAVDTPTYQKTITYQLRFRLNSRWVNGDSADVAYGDNEQEMHSQLAALESRELDRLDLAIQAIEEGSYGTCRTCHGKIPVARLKAIPDATTCISCQRLNEQRGTNGGFDADWESAWRFEAKLHDGDLTVQDVRMDR